MKVSTDLSTSQREKMLRLVAEYYDVFTSTPGTTNLAEHKIETSTNQPARAKSYTYTTRELIRKEV